MVWVEFLSLEFEIILDMFDQVQTCLNNAKIGDQLYFVITSCFDVPTML